MAAHSGLPEQLMWFLCIAIASVIPVTLFIALWATKEYGLTADEVVRILRAVGDLFGRARRHP